MLDKTKIWKSLRNEQQRNLKILIKPFVTAIIHNKKEKGFSKNRNKSILGFGNPAALRDRSL